MDARKVRIGMDNAWNLLQGAKNITTAKGKKIQKWNPQMDEKTAILKDAMGPSGNLRAPAYRMNNEYIIGFNPNLYDELFGEDS